MDSSKSQSEKSCRFLYWITFNNWSEI